MQIKIQKGTDGDVSLCIYGTNQNQTLSSLFSLLNVLEVQISSYRQAFKDAQTVD